LLLGGEPESPVADVQAKSHASFLSVRRSALADADADEYLSSAAGTLFPREVK
jgi:hypothetical protein